MPGPNKAKRQWRDELKEALSFGTDHLSLYQLTIEPGTPFAVLYRDGALKIPDEALAVDLYEATQELTEAAGRPAYEISNHAKPGSESRHNLIYWRYQRLCGGRAGRAWPAQAGRQAHRHLHHPPAGTLARSGDERRKQLYRFRARQR